MKFEVGETYISDGGRSSEFSFVVTELSKDNIIIVWSRKGGRKDVTFPTTIKEFLKENPSIRKLTKLERALK